MSSKKTIPLNDFITLQRGFDLPRNDRQDGVIPVVASTGVGGYHNEAKATAPGVVIGRSGSIGGGQYITEDFWPLNTTLWVKDFKGHNPRYVYYLMRSIDFSTFNVGTGVPTLNRNHLSSVDVTVLDEDSEIYVTKCLGSLDDKIQLNHQINQTLEEIAQAIFKSWFVDFEPVKAKIAALEAGGNEDDALLAAMQAIAGNALFASDAADADAQTQLARLQTEHPEQYATLRATADLFPAAMQDSELGEIPQGWEVKPFGELLIKTIGGDWGKEVPDEKHTAKVKILRGTDLPNVYAGSDDKVPTRYVDPKKLATRKLESGDIVIEVSGGSPTQPTGRSLYLTQETIDRLDADLEPASFCRLFRPKSKEVGLILGLYLQKIYDEGKTWLYQNTSTGISNFQTSFFLESELVAIPSIQIKKVFYEMVMPYLKKISSSENKSLAELRDTLLPKLLSGELSISAAIDQITQAEEAIDV